MAKDKNGTWLNDFANKKMAIAGIFLTIAGYIAIDAHNTTMDQMKKMSKDIDAVKTEVIRLVDRKLRSDEQERKVSDNTERIIRLEASGARKGRR